MKTKQISETKTSPKPRTQPFISPSFIQRKLSIGSSNDAYEQEADRIADRVVGMPDSEVAPTKQTGALVQRKCAACEQEERVQKKALAESITPLVQKKGNGEAGGEASQALTQQIQSSRGGGSGMDNQTQNYMESRFGADFSGVNIHTSSQAIHMSRNLNAQAFTVGNDIYFNEGNYNPSSTTGKHLLAHELAHTLQQRGSIRRTVIQRQIACPDQFNRDDAVPTGFKRYFRDSCTFHCCFTGILENRIPTPQDPQNECFYDDFGNLVDENHVYAGCAGTPNDYDSSSSPLDHTFNDRGGIRQAGGRAYRESSRFRRDRALVDQIGTTSYTEAQPHLGRRRARFKTGLVWVAIGSQEVLIIAKEVSGVGRLQFMTWVNTYFRDNAIQNSLRQGTIPSVPRSAIITMPSGIPNYAITR